MKQIKITHKTVYYYHKPVTFGPHRALVRPREGHDIHIASSLLEIEPKANVRWLRDIYGNSIVIFTFTKPGRRRDRRRRRRPIRSPRRRHRSPDRRGT